MLTPLYVERRRKERLFAEVVIGDYEVQIFGTSDATNLLRPLIAAVASHCYMTAFYIMDESDDDDFVMDPEYIRIFDKLAQDARLKHDDDTTVAQEPSRCPLTDTQAQPQVDKVMTLPVDRAAIPSPYRRQDQENSIEEPKNKLSEKEKKQQEHSYIDTSRKSSSSFFFGSGQRTNIVVETVNTFNDSSSDSIIVNDQETSVFDVRNQTIAVPNNTTRDKFSSQDLSKEANILEAGSVSATTSNDDDSGDSSESSSVDTSNSDISDTSDLSSSSPSGSISSVSTENEVNEARGSIMISLRQDESLEVSLPSKPNQTVANPCPKKNISNLTTTELLTFATDRNIDQDSQITSNARSSKGSQQTLKPNTNWAIPTADSHGSSAARPLLSTKVTEAPSPESPEVQDYRRIVDDKEAEIDPKLYAPPVYRPRPRPILKEYNIQRHPIHTRKKLPISSLFAPPMDKLWKGKYEEFNPFQSEMAKWMCDTDDNVVVSAPTGAGKSTIFEIAMARFITTDLLSQGATTCPNQSHVLSKARKILYIAPSKALCEERYEDWSRRLQNLGFRIEVAMITGDTADPGSSFSDLTSAHLIIATPEKWDSMTRRWQENFYLMASVKLLLVDEVHLLGDKTRGWCLETVVTRMKTIHQAAQAVDVSPDELSRSSYAGTNAAAIKTPFRMVAVSATLPNIAEVADFFQANEAYSFDDSYRPIPLTKHIMAMGSRGKNEWKFWSNMVRYSHSKLL
jgi:superfamily II RNA helicase